MRLARKPFDVSTMIANQCRCFSIEPIKVEIGKTLRVHHQLLLLKGDTVAVPTEDHASLHDPCVDRSLPHAHQDEPVAWEDLYVWMGLAWLSFSSERLR